MQAEQLRAEAEETIQKQLEESEIKFLDELLKGSKLDSLSS